jgi:uncharacterized protein YgbK (DUF1537 family)
LQAIVSGSCSRATNAQVAAFRAAGLPAIALDPLRLQRGGVAVEQVVAETLEACQRDLSDGPVLVYSTAEPEALKSIQERLGVQQAGQLVEQTLASVAVGLVRQGVRQLIVAGGETSGAVVQALGMTQLQIGAQIDGAFYLKPMRQNPATSFWFHLQITTGNQRSWILIASGTWTCLSMTNTPAVRTSRRY